MANDDNATEKQPDKELPKSENHLQEKVDTQSSSPSKDEETSEEEAIPTEVVEAIKKLPPREKEMMSSLFLSMERISSPSSSLLAKRITSEHITKTIDNREKENEWDFKKSQANEVTKRLGMGAVLLLVLIVLGYSGITKDKDLAEKVIIAGISAIGRFGLGVAVNRQDS